MVIAPFLEKAKLLSCSDGTQLEKRVHAHPAPVSLQEIRDMLHHAQAQQAPF
jgi:hypothetical protein